MRLDERSIGFAVAAGGLGFAGFWVGGLLKVELVPWPVALAWHGLATLLIANRRDRDTPLVAGLSGAGFAELARNRACRGRSIVLARSHDVGMRVLRRSSPDGDAPPAMGWRAPRGWGRWIPCDQGPQRTVLE